MANPGDNYAKLIFRRYGYLAAWWPNTKVQLGDVGLVEGVHFKQMTALKQLGVDFAVRVGDTPLDFSDDHTAGLQVQANVGSEVTFGSSKPVAKVGISIDFGDRGAFLFHAVRCYQDEIEDKDRLGKALIHLIETNDWDPSWSVVDTVVRAGCSTILIANSRNARVELKAQASCDVSNLANPELGLEVSYKKGDVTLFAAEQGLTPLFRLSKVHQSWLDWLSGKSPIVFGGPQTSAVSLEPKRPVLESVILQTT